MCGEELPVQIEPASSFCFPRVCARSARRLRARPCGSAELKPESVPLDKSALPLARPRFVHPHPPCDGPGLLIGDGVSGQLQSQLDLTVMVALVPDHVLKKQDRIVVVHFHL